MFCSKCGSSIRYGAKFCPKCGAAVATRDEAYDKSAEVEESSKSAEVDSAVHTAAQVIQDASSAELQMDAKEVRQTGVSKVTALAELSPESIVLLVMDVALFVLVTFIPWMGSSFAVQNRALSLPSLVIESIKLLGQARQYSSHAYNSGAGLVYETVMGMVCLIAIIVGVGWALVAKSIYNDAKCDFKGQVAPGNSGRNVAILAALAQLFAWFAVAYTQSQLKGEYIDLSFAATDVVRTTSWVWISFLVGLGVYCYRKKYQGVSRSIAQ